MSELKNVEIHCAACGREALLMRKPKYDGFKKVGEELTCSACGHVYAAEQDVPFKGQKPVSLFTAADRSPDIKLFAAGENSRLCRYCVHYIVNPFRQWCARHGRDVEATDTCNLFAARPQDNKAEDKTASPPPPKPLL